MSQENVELVRRGYELLNRGELRLDQFGPEFEVVEPLEQPGAQTRYGREGVRDSIASLSEAFDEFQFEPERFEEIGDNVVAFFKARGRGKGSGIVVESEVVHVWTLRDGSPVRVRIYLDPKRALEAAGLSE